MEAEEDGSVEYKDIAVAAARKAVPKYLAAFLNSKMVRQLSPCCCNDPC